VSVKFHDGTDKLYQAYTQSKAWDDTGLLQLNPTDQWDKFLIAHNTEEKLKTLLAGNGVTYCTPEGYSSKLGEYRDSDERSFIVLKGLHQWQRKGNTADYKLHITIGLDGKLWHLYANYFAKGQKIAFSTDCSAGEKISATDNEGFTQVGKKR